MVGDLIQKDKVQRVSQTYGAALKGFAAEIPAGKVGAVRSDPRVAFVAKDREVHVSTQTLPKGVNRVDADLRQRPGEIGTSPTTFRPPTTR